MRARIWSTRRSLSRRAWRSPLRPPDLALWLATGRGGRPPLILSAIAFGIAVSGMHYTAMEGVTLFPHASASAGAPALSTDLLAIVVAIVAFCVSAIFLLILVPDRTAACASVLPVGHELPAQMPAAPMATLQRRLLRPATRSAMTRSWDGAPMGRSAGAGAPPRRFARHLPIERDGSTQFLAVDDVVAIHANAHYSYIFNGSDKLFCPLAIGDVESRLDGRAGSVRVHRSHIVNIDRVVGCKRSGDSEMVEMDAAEQYAVPISRSRVSRLKSRIASKVADPGLTHSAGPILHRNRPARR